MIKQVRRNAARVGTRGRDAPQRNALHAHPTQRERVTLIGCQIFPAEI